MDVDSVNEKENDMQKVIFCYIFPQAKKPILATQNSAAYDVFSCTKRAIEPGHREKFSLGFQMKLPEGYCAKLYGRSGMTAKHGIHLPGGVSIIDEDFLGPVSLYLQNSDLSKQYEIKICDRIVQMMIEKVQEVKWVEGTVDDFNIEETDVNEACDCPAAKNIRNLKGYGITGI